MRKILTLKKGWLVGIALAFAFTLPVGDERLGFDPAFMNTSVKPGDDFYEYASGTWVKNNPVPEDESSWGSFHILHQKNELLLNKILEEAARDAADASAQMSDIRRKVGVFYKVAMDTVMLERQGLRIVSNELRRIDGISNTDDLIKVIGQNHRRGISGAFNFGVNQDLKNSEAYIAYAGQGGLGLPDRDYYFKEDDKSKEIRAAYVRHIANMFVLFGFGPKAADASASIIMNFETELARVCLTKVELRNPEKVYNKKTTEELAVLTPHINWNRYLTEIGAPKMESLVVSNPAFYEYLDSAFKTMSIADWKTYLKWKVMTSAAPYLNKAVRDERFSFVGTVLSGVKTQKPRWKTVVNSANNLIGELVAQEYVKVAFSPESKKRVEEMVDNLVVSYQNRIKNLDWMSAATKEKALEKLAAFNRKLGYPDRWVDYNSLEIRSDSYFDNYLRASQFGYDYNMNKLGKPIERWEWKLLPQEINAYYTPLLNEIVFPAAIMQPPFYYPDADDAVNYGSMGAVIGHEISHGFDDQGSKFDAKGNLNSWWTDEDRKLFEARTKMLSAQFNEYFVEPELHVNGDLTLGENIADLAGLTAAFDALQLHLKKHGRQDIQGFTPEQRFFIGYGQIWKGNYRPEAMRQQVLTNVHAPGKYRVLGPLSNLDIFYQIFDLTPDNKMYRPEKERVKIW